uniref:Single insulin-like growth factor-binding domain protein-2 n=1 Tax=Cupiennius salei TaxID=6928 RepID=SIBD2_CUPSA|nr:RecName: Full=Single insulin-like growth factor-binding domain protein-2; Short=SIBD-2; Flags: Precursor [Cupiennius salei]CCD22033.1 single insulin-like growth factor-binding domain protein-2 [Cupiennius salei]
MESLFIFAFGMMLSSASALSCIPCVPEECEDPGPCEYGKVLDPCQCCLICRKGPGEICGGPWNLQGVCAEGFACITLSGNPVMNLNGGGQEVGRCRKKY